MEITFFYFISAVHVFEADVVPRISALTRSCVVIPCTFDIGSEPVTRLRGLWYDTNGDYVYHTGQTNVMDNFKGRTELLGEPDEKNCTLEIDDVKAHDNGPFCFHAEKGNDKYRFNHSCVFIVMKASPDKPVISGLPEEMEPGKKFSLSCSVTHTCPSHPPTIKWSIKTAKEVVSHMEGSAGQWKTTSTVTFIPTGYENEDDLLCSASFWRGKKQETAIYLPITSEYRKIQVN
uniref:Si:dkey-238d18.9 n=1 Tax=Astyanax mexicanus TaxID=7994 RepID=A0A8B9KCR6_ASTMX